MYMCVAYNVLSNRDDYVWPQNGDEKTLFVSKTRANKLKSRITSAIVHCGRITVVRSGGQPRRAADTPEGAKLNGDIIRPAPVSPRPYNQRDSECDAMSIPKCHSVNAQMTF